MDDSVTESSRLEPSERVMATKGGCSPLKRCSTGWEGVHGVWRVKVGGRAWRQAGWSPGELARTLFVPSPSCAPWAGHHLHHGHQHHVQHTQISQWQCPVCDHEDFIWQLVSGQVYQVQCCLCHDILWRKARCLPIEQQQSLRFHVCCWFALSQHKSELKPHSFVMRRLTWQCVTSKNSVVWFLLEWDFVPNNWHPWTCDFWVGGWIVWIRFKPELGQVF